MDGRRFVADFECGSEFICVVDERISADDPRRSRTAAELSHGSCWMCRWRCSFCGVEWRATPNSRTGSSDGGLRGCRACKHRRRRPLKGSLGELFPSLAAEYMVEENGRHPNEVPAASIIPAKWQCSYCRDIFMMPPRFRAITPRPGCTSCKKSRAAGRHFATAGGVCAPEYAAMRAAIARARRDGRPVDADLTNYEAFIAEVGRRPDGHILVLLQPELGFVRGNLFWCLGRARSVHYIIDGKVRFRSELAKTHGLTPAQVDWRIRHSIPLNTAVDRSKQTTAIRRRYKAKAQEAERGRQAIVAKHKRLLGKDYETVVCALRRLVK